MTAVAVAVAVATLSNALDKEISSALGHEACRLLSSSCHAVL
jgi:hypothetical protein